MAFKDNILRIRHEQGLTQAEAGKRLGLPQHSAQVTWARWETGTRKPGCATMIQRIADALGVDVGELFK